MTLLTLVATITLGMPVPLTGTVSDAAGRPVAGAMVWLGDTIATRKGSDLLASGETDSRGQFKLERGDDVVGRGNMWSPTLWAYKPGSHIVGIEFKANLPAANEPVRLTLGPAASKSVRVVRPDGSPASGARVRPLMAPTKTPWPPGKLLDQLAVTTGVDGRATIDGLAAADIFALDVTVPGQIVQCLPIDDDGETVTLRPVGKLKVRIVADDPKAVRGWSVKAWSHPTETRNKGPYNTHWVSEDTGIDGRAELPPIATGQVRWELKPPAGSNYLPAKEPATMIRAGETTEVELPIRKAVRVEGVLLEDSSRTPVPGVSLHFIPLGGSGSQTLRKIVTDEKGQFSELVNPGKFRFNFLTYEMPKDYFLPPRTQHWIDFEVKEGEERHELTPPRLRKGVLVRGKVIDDQGKPAPMIQVTGTWTSAEFGENPNSVQALTDGQGNFVLGNIAPKSQIRVSASAGLIAKSDMVTFTSAGEGEPITLHLSKNPTLALSGRVLGADGKPLADAAVRVRIRPPDQAYNSGSQFSFAGDKEVRTGRDGRFQTPAELPVGNHFRVEARATGFDIAESKWIVPPDVTIPDLTLKRATGSHDLNGRVVDSAGKPVVGAEVFQSSDEPRRTRTNAEGCFRISSVPDAPILLFVSAPGYHFIGRRIELNERSVEFALRRLQESPAAPLRAAAPAVTREDERTIARALIAAARKDGNNTNDLWEKRDLPAITAMVDPDLAVEMIENQVVTAEPALLSSIALGRFESDPRAALATLDAIDSPETVAVTALTLFDRLGTAAPLEFRRELLERAGRFAVEIKPPLAAARQTARTADRWFDIGEHDRGKALALKAATLTKMPPPQEPGVTTITFGDDGSRDDLALALARVDLDEAKKCLEGRQQAQRLQLDTTRGGIARRIAANDPPGARRMLAAIEEANRLPARRIICLAMATTDLPTARVVAANGRDPMIGVILPAVAARAKAATDPDRARLLLRETVEHLNQPNPELARWGSSSLVLARLLPLIAKVDPDRAPDAFWRALSLRASLPVVPERGFVSPQTRQQYLELTKLAALIGRYDHAAAEVVFAPVASRLPLIDEQHWGLAAEGPAIFLAAGAFDARAAKALLDALPEDPTPPPASNVIRASDHRHRSKAQARIALARSLGLPRALRLHTPLPLQSVSDDWLNALDE